MYQSSTSTQADGLLSSSDLADSLRNAEHRIFAPPRLHQVNSARSNNSLSVDDVSSLRTENTQDLAEFLKTSSPEDHGIKGLKGSSSEEILFGGNTRKKSFKFLRASVSKWKDGPVKEISRTKSEKPLPDHVLARTTSRGQPYLQIHVDYAKSYFQALKSHEIETVGDLAPDDLFLEDDYRNSVIADSSFTGGASTLVSPRPSSLEERPKLSPAPWNVSDRVLDADTVETYNQFNQFLDSERQSHTQSESGNGKPRSLSIEAVGGSERPPPTDVDSSSAEFELLRAYQFQPLPRKSEEHSAAGLVPGEDYIRPPASSKDAGHEAASGEGPPTPSDSTAAPGHRRHSRKAPPRPGPPPTRSLPSLPEGCNAALKRTPDADARASLVSTSGSTASDMSGPSSARAKSRAGSVGSDARSREDRVRARKARDMARQRRGSAGGGERRRSGDDRALFGRDSGEHAPGVAASAGPPLPLAAMGVAPAAAAVVARQASLKYGPGSGPTPPHSPRTVLPSSAPSPTMSSARSFASEKEMELEARVRAVEKKNRMLEQALIAVIRGGLGRDQRRAELHRADALEDLLKELRLLDAEAGGTK